MFSLFVPIIIPILQPVIDTKQSNIHALGVTIGLTEENVGKTHKEKRYIKSVDGKKIECVIEIQDSSGKQIIRF